MLLSATWQLIGVFLIGGIRERYSFPVYPFIFPLKTNQVCNSDGNYRMNTLSKQWILLVSNLELNGLSDWALSVSVSVSCWISAAGRFPLQEAPHQSEAACQDVVQGWLEVGALVLGDGLEKIPLLNRRPRLYGTQDRSATNREAEELMKATSCSSWRNMTFKTQCSL